MTSCCFIPVSYTHLDVYKRQDVVLYCCDNFATRHAINAACVKHHKPLVSGAAIRFDGQVTVYDLSLIHI